MESIAMHKAKSSLSQLVKRANGGETILISGHGRAEAALVPVSDVKRKKRLGILKDKLTIPDDFDAPLPTEFLAAFTAREE
ncbi:MAG: type II toxin-antitoxin system prevent-host-death family antitoxin [Desulfobulbaceae bacterium]|jgi:prevent-host-death family protein|nr:type II toxin-antitoxin system prevent-host-death family antitoxin [Desulfobulbaceae bacterium]